MRICLSNTLCGKRMKYRETPGQNVPGILTCECIKAWPHCGSDTHYPQNEIHLESKH